MYVIKEADIGKFINLHVMYINRFGDPITKQSNTRVGPVAPPLIGPAGLTARVSGGIVTLSWILDPDGSGDPPTGYEYCYTATAVNDCESMHSVAGLDAGFRPQRDHRRPHQRRRCTGLRCGQSAAASRPMR